MENAQLTHWGIKGMKWGVRRYQNKDGSLTPAGRKRYSEEGESSGSSGSSKSSSSNTSGKKKISEMSNDELRERTTRINLELQYKEAIARANPDKMRRAKKLVSDLAESAVRNLGQKAIEKGINSLMGSGSKEEKRTNLSDVGDVSKLSDKKLQEMLKRASSENALQKLLDDRNAKK